MSYQNPHQDFTIDLGEGAQEFELLAPASVNYYSFVNKGPSRIRTRTNPSDPKTERIYDPNASFGVFAPFIPQTRYNSRVRTHRWMEGDLVIKFFLVLENGAGQARVEVSFVE